MQSEIKKILCIRLPLIGGMGFGTRITTDFSSAGSPSILSSSSILKQSSRTSFVLYVRFFDLLTLWHGYEAFFLLRQFFRELEPVLGLLRLLR